MNPMQIEYWEAFNKLGKNKLHDRGFLYELLPANPEFSELFRIRLVKGNASYILSFSSHHLDYQDGVTVTKNDWRVLPASAISEIHDNPYDYTDNGIRRIINDICNLRS